jgi:alpha-glucosidase
MRWVRRNGRELVFARDSGLVCALNFGPDAVEPPPGELLLASGELADGKLQPDMAAWFRA